MDIITEAQYKLQTAEMEFLIAHGWKPFMWDGRTLWRDPEEKGEVPQLYPLDQAIRILKGQVSSDDIIFLPPVEQIAS
jgi:hypothetical protein